MTIGLFHKVSFECSRIITSTYSTSFSSAIRLLHRQLQTPVYNIYGMVRLADEIVDTFHDHDKSALLERLKTDTFEAIEKGISTNPVLNSFQQTVNRYHIDHHLVNAFFRSMESDLANNRYDRQGYEEYIYGSAEVVGLMCLHVFCEGNSSLYRKLEPAARALGAAFQKVNFLRDIQSDFNDLSRMYFPGCDFQNFTQSDKYAIESDIENDFHNAYRGIVQLPMKARFGVYVAYKYYSSLFGKIKSAPPQLILRRRVRIPSYQKALILLRAGVKNSLRLI
ncbi:MAG TPA: phytoene/squalene synthase family protein [Flavisolibacter sp.]